MKKTAVFNDSGRLKTTESVKKYNVCSTKSIYMEHLTVKTKQ